MSSNLSALSRLPYLEPRKHMMTSITLNPGISSDSARQQDSAPFVGTPSTAQQSHTINNAHLTREHKRPRVRSVQDPIRAQLKTWGLALLPRGLGLALLILIWAIIAEKNEALPTPWFTLLEAIKVFSDPFYQNGPNDQGIGWNIFASLKRVGLGFGLAALIGIPLGLMIGRFR